MPLSIKVLAELFSHRAREAKQVTQLNRGALRTLYERTTTSLSTRDWDVQELSTIRLHVLNHIGEFHGVEYIKAANGEVAEYLNAGDTYVPTLILWRGCLRVQSLGDFVETMERRRIKFP